MNDDLEVYEVFEEEFKRLLGNVREKFPDILIEEVRISWKRPEKEAQISLIWS
jgi:hypothetical protein